MEFQDRQVAVNDPFDFETNPNDSDYRVVKRFKMEDGEFETEFYEGEPMFKPLKGYVRLDKNEKLNFEIGPNDSNSLIKFTLFISKRHNRHRHDEEDSDFKKVMIEASFCLVIGPTRPTHPVAKASKKDFYAILKDESINLGRKKVFFFNERLIGCSRDISDGPPFHAEVVVKFLHERSLTERCRCSSLIQDLAKLFDDKKQTDFNIVCDGETFRCHKAILAARSEVFYSMFQMSGITENKSGEVKVVDIDAKTMKSLLMYMYQNHFPGAEADMNLLYAADKYNLVELVSHCQESIMKNISDETVLDIAVSSRLLASQEVYKAAKKFIDTRPIKSLKAGTAWKKFKKENPKEAMKIAEKSTKKKTKK
jgi:hypothetical protein